MPLQVTVPQHRLTPLKNSWMSLYTPVTENMKLDMRMNLKAKKVTRFPVRRYAEWNKSCYAKLLTFRFFAGGAENQCRHPRRE